MRYGLLRMLKGETITVPNISKTNYSMLEWSIGIVGLTKATLGPEEARASQLEVASLLRKQGAALSPSELLSPETMIKELDNRGQEKVTPRKLFNEESGEAGSENSQMSPSAEEVGGYSSDGSSRSRSRGRPRTARKHRKECLKKNGNL
ncbi:hypothetical protein Tco_0047634 [Tanacetum coccineum]